MGARFEAGVNAVISCYSRDERRSYLFKVCSKKVWGRISMYSMSCPSRNLYKRAQTGPLSTEDKRTTGLLETLLL